MFRVFSNLILKHHSFTAYSCGKNCQTLAYILDELISITLMFYRKSIYLDLCIYDSQLNILIYMFIHGLLHICFRTQFSSSIFENEDAIQNNL